MWLPDTHSLNLKGPVPIGIVPLLPSMNLPAASGGMMPGNPVSPPVNAVTIIGPGSSMVIFIL